MLGRINARRLSPAERDGNTSPTHPLLLVKTDNYTIAITIRSMSMPERVRFTHAYYGLWKLSFSPVSTLRDTFAAITFKEILYLFEIGYQWAQTIMSSEIAAQLGFPHEKWQPLFVRLYPIFIEKRERVLSRYVTWPDMNDAPQDLFSVFDQFQQEEIFQIPDMV